MEDSGIVALYLARSENAIEETSVKYGKYCYAIAYNLLSNKQDADESVNDACLGAWNSIPPHRPAVLSSFLGKIVRRVSINRWKERGRKKRGGGAGPLGSDGGTMFYTFDAPVVPGEAAYAVLPGDVRVPFPAEQSGRGGEASFAASPSPRG